MWFLPWHSVHDGFVEPTNVVCAEGKKFLPWHSVHDGFVEPTNVVMSIPTALTAYDLTSKQSNEQDTFNNYCSWL
jgi:hypothetical protein